MQICKKGSVEQYSAVPYLATLINCLVWTLYGLPMVHPHSVLVVTINGAGCAIEIIYIILYLIYSDRKKRLKVLLGLLLELIFIALLTFFALTMVHTVKKRSAIVGTICMLFNITMYASPLSVMVSDQNLKTIYDHFYVGRPRKIYFTSINESNLKFDLANKVHIFYNIIF